MSDLVVLPALRAARAYEAGLAQAKEMGLDVPAVRAILATFLDKLEEGARRYGNTCPVGGCREIVEHKGDWRGYHCPEHGYVQMARLLVAWDPVTSHD